MLSIADILERLGGTEDALCRGIDFIDQRLAIERDRGRNVESRAVAMLALVGIATGFIVSLTDTFAVQMKTEIVLSPMLYLLSVVYLLKSGYYAVSIMQPARRYQLTPHLIYEIQDLEKREMLRQELAWKIWEYEAMVMPNTRLLYLLSRSQRNAIAGISSLFIFAIWILYLKLNPGQVPSLGIRLFFGVTLIAFLFASDHLAEQRGLWSSGERGSQAMDEPQEEDNMLGPAESREEDLEEGRP